MKLAHAMTFAFAIALTAKGAAVPPPPAVVPDALTRPIEGYEVQTLYQLWRGWIESRKGAAVDALLAQPEEIEGERPFGEPILRFAKHNDFGHFLTGEIRVYCRPATPYDFVPGSCHYRLRRAYVQHEAATYGGEENPVSLWMQRSFDAPRLVRHLRESGLAPETDWWRASGERIFAGLTSPIPMLMENATIVRLDSRDCPTMAQAIESMDRERIDWRIDLYGVGRDRPIEELAAHAVWTTFTLSIRTPAGFATIESQGSAINRIVAPVLDAADACERARAR